MGVVTVAPMDKLLQHEGLYEHLFNTTQAFLAILRPSERAFLSINRYGLQLFEIKDVAEFVALLNEGKLWVQPQKDVATYVESTINAVKQQGCLERETHYITTSGRRFWGLVRIDPFQIKEELLFIVKITDINSFKSAALIGQRTTEQLQALFNNSTIGIVVTNAKGEIINFNHFAETQFGYSKDELEGQPVEVLIPLKFRQHHPALRQNFSAHPQNRTMGAGRDLFARRKDGSEFPVEVSLNHYRIEEDHFVVAFVVDITVRKKSEAALLQQKEELEKYSAQVLELNAELEKKVEGRTRMLRETLDELERSKEDLRLALAKEKELSELKSKFVTMASHEFRTPLSTILSSSHLVQEYKGVEDQEKRKKHLGKIQNAVRNLTFILEDFLSLEKLEEGRIQVQLQPLTAAHLLEEVEGVAEEMKTILKAGQRFTIHNSISSDIVADPKLLRNILINLLSNASKYSPENSVIAIEMWTHDNTVKISVKDQGIGIPEKEQKNLFERFFRASNAVTIQGTGLGLHIVSRYLNLMNGQIEMKSEINKGTTFIIMLPIVPK